jgi:glycosyltransferase involved in cell wall biosynthesis
MIWFFLFVLVVGVQSFKCHDAVCDNAFALASLHAKQQTVVPLLAAAIMVKNEADAMKLSMESLHLVGITTLFVFDTGSTDGTQAVVRDEAARLGLQLDLFEGPFVDFSTSRNYMLRRVEGRSRWLLLLDAGDIIVVTTPGDELDALLEESLRDDRLCSILLEQQWNSGSSHYVNRLIRNDGTWMYVQPVHEYLLRVSDAEACVDMELRDAGDEFMQFMLWQNRTVSGRTSGARWLRDVGVLERELVRDPTNSRAAYYLGNTYSALGMHREAIVAFKRRIGMHGWYEEIEMSKISIVSSYIALGDLASANYWSIDLYEENKRIEGLMALARHALDVQNNSALCFAYTDMACQVPSIRRSLFLDTREYETFRFNLRKLCWDNLRKEFLTT